MDITKELGACQVLSGLRTAKTFEHCQWMSNGAATVEDNMEGLTKMKHKLLCHQPSPPLDT